MSVMSEVKDNKDQKRFELVVEDQLVFANYRIEGETLYINYVEAPVSLRGTGAAGKLMEGIVALAKRENYNIVPICSYAAAWLRRHAN